MKPVDWPRYMVSRKLAGGKIGYYREPRPKDVKAGCSIEGEALGADYGAARERAEQLNQALDAWRSGTPIIQPGPNRAGTID